MLSALKAFTAYTKTVSNTAVSITTFTGYTAATRARANKAIIGVRTNGIMLTFDGTTPTATVGIFVAANGTYQVEGQSNITALQFIREAAADAAVTITLLE